MACVSAQARKKESCMTLHLLHFRRRSHRHCAHAVNPLAYMKKAQKFPKTPSKRSRLKADSLMLQVPVSVLPRSSIGGFFSLYAELLSERRKPLPCPDC